MLSITGYALILTQAYKDRLNLCEKYENGDQATEYQPSTSVEKHSTHKILLSTNGLWSKSLDCAIDANKRLITEQVDKHIT